jgi:HSP20 family molecular chaperone IbpA
MKGNKLFCSMNLLLVALINIAFLSSTQARSYKRCTALGACNDRKQANVSQYRHQAGNRILDHMSEIFSIPVPLNSLIEQQKRQITNMYHTSAASLRYDIADNDDKMELSLDLPGVSANDVTLTLLEARKVLKVTGSRKYRRNGETAIAKFDQMFTIDPSILDISNIEARLTDGVLVITAPKLLKTEKKELTIPIAVVEQNEKEQPLIENQVKNGNQKGEAQEVEETVLDGLEMTEEEDL